MTVDPLAAPAPSPGLSPVTLAAFAFAVSLHAAFLWWLLGARFGHDNTPPNEPIFVVVVADDADDPGAAPAALSAASAPLNESAQRDLEKVATSSSLNGTSTPPTAPESDAAESGAEKDAVIAVDKSVDNPVQKSVDKLPAPKQTSVKNETATLPATPSAANSTPRGMPAPPAQTRAQRPAETSQAKSQSVGDAGSAGSSAVASAAASGSAGIGSSAGPRRIVRPDYLDGPPLPVYPPSARSRRQQGKVIVRVVINTTGQPVSVNVLQTSGFDVLDRAALDAVGRVHFRPYAENGVALEAQVDIPFDFVLRN